MPLTVHTVWPPFVWLVESHRISPRRPLAGSAAPVAAPWEGVAEAGAFIPGDTSFAAAQDPAAQGHAAGWVRGHL